MPPQMAYQQLAQAQTGYQQPAQPQYDGNGGYDDEGVGYQPIAVNPWPGQNSPTLHNPGNLRYLRGPSFWQPFW